MYLRPESIEELHIEITNKCNAACPMCDRNIHGGPDRPGRGTAEWSLNDIDRVFNQELPNLKTVYFCGTHGEPLSAKNLFEAIAAAKGTGAKIEMFTNGSLRSRKWWEKLLTVLGPEDRITFGVDGLETNHLYRQNTNINKIMENMYLCSKANIDLRWDFLVFKHNEHEIEDCKKVAKEFGIKHFRLRRTARFDRHIKFPVLDKNLQLTHYLEIPENKEYRHPGTEDMQMIISDLQLNGSRNLKRSDFEFEKRNLPKEWKVNCIYQESKKIYVNSRLEVFPCCYISDEWETYKVLSEGQLLPPFEDINLKTSTWVEILDTKFYKEDLVKSWEENNVMPRCIRTCGKVKRESEQNLLVWKE